MSVSQVADSLSAQYGVTISPRAITMLFYERALRTDLCPIVGGRRRIPTDYVPQIAAVLRRRGRIAA
jgi:fibrillarin-like rRNA methylase